MLPTVPPAPPVPREPGAGHTHPGPVFGYILHGEIENLVEPDPPQIYKTGEVFSEIAFHVHRYLRNKSQTEPADVLVFQAGDTGQKNPVVKLLGEEPFQKTANQEVSLRRLTLAAGPPIEVGADSGAGLVYVLEGRIEVSSPGDQPKSYGTGEVFAVSADRVGLNSIKVSGTGPARLLFYRVDEKRAEK
jgi:quercetin dioxygenase-like cupin family protein